jgi:hypothetical protein
MIVTQLASKTQILELLAQAEALLDTATVDGDLLRDCVECDNEIRDALCTLTQAIDYYVD